MVRSFLNNTVVIIVIFFNQSQSSENLQHSSVNSITRLCHWIDGRTLKKADIDSLESMDPSQIDLLGMLLLFNGEKANVHKFLEGRFQYRLKQALNVLKSNKLLASFNDLYTTHLYCLQNLICTNLGKSLLELIFNCSNSSGLIFLLVQLYIL